MANTNDNRDCLQTPKTKQFKEETLHAMKHLRKRMTNTCMLPDRSQTQTEPTHGYKTRPDH